MDNAKVSRAGAETAILKNSHLSCTKSAAGDRDPGSPAAVFELTYTSALATAETNEFLCLQDGVGAVGRPLDDGDHCFPAAVPGRCLRARHAAGADLGLGSGPCCRGAGLA